jgi:hypothetical protein
MNFSKIVFTGLLTASICSGALIQKDVVLFEGRGIDLSTQTIKTLTNTDTSHIDLFSQCSVIVKNQFNLAFFSTGLWDNTDVGCGGKIYGILSKYFIRELKSSFIDFSQPLNVLDTAFYSIPKQNACSLWTAKCQSIDNPCSSDHSFRPIQTIWYLGMTHEGNYFLFRSYSRESVYDSLSKKNLPAANVTFFLQTDGSLDFKGAKVSVADLTKNNLFIQNASGPSLVKKFGIPPALKAGDNVYDIRGRLICGSAGAARQLNRASMIFIVKRDRDKKAKDLR